MFITVLSICIAIVIAPVMYLVYKSMKRPRNFPPGPKSIPIIGSIHHLGSESYLSIPKLAKKYGDVFSVKLFGKDLVCVHGYEANKEMLFTKAKDFCDRPINMLSSLIKGENSAGIADGFYGPKWAAGRKLFHTVMREQGVGPGAENIVRKEASYLITELENKTEKDMLIDPEQTINFAVVNVIASFVFGDRYEYTNEKMKRLIKINDDFFKTNGLFTDPLFFLPALFPPLAKLWIPNSLKRMLGLLQNLADFCTEEIERHKENIDPQCPRDYIDHYLLKMREEGHSDNPIYTEHELRFTLLDMFQAGSDTTTTTLRWAVLLMAGHQDVQRKVQSEIDEVLGFDKEAKYGNRLVMPYTEAVIHEVQRFASIAAIGLFHAPIKDTEFYGYSIPKGTMVLPNLRSSNYQKDKWKNAGEFFPQNFLNEEGQFEPNDAFIPFGGGLRICVGMSIAKQELFLFLVAILQKFHIKPERDGFKFDYKPISGFVLYPQHYNYRFIRRE